MNHSHLVHDIQLGQVQARIWSSSDPVDGDLSNSKFQITIHRIEKEGQRSHVSDRFDIDDIAMLNEVLDMAHLWICEQQLALA